MEKTNGGVWLRGNLHMHTDRSDGQRLYDDAIRLYEEAGYDFIAVTDHWVVSTLGRTDGGMLLLSGCEYNVGETVKEGIYHIVAIGMENDPQIERRAPGLDAQRIIDEVNAHGGIAVLAHPAWSLNSADEAAKLHGLSGTEIFNTTSGFPMNVRPYSGLFVDQLASKGILMPCIAADDAHQYTYDVHGGWIMLYAKEKSHAAVMEALREGSFYATEGPELHARREGGRIHVTCTPAERIVFYSNNVWNPERVFTGEGITQATYTIGRQDDFVRIEVIAKDGKRAYSSPMSVRE